MKRTREELADGYLRAMLSDSRNNSTGFDTLVSLAFVAADAFLAACEQGREEKGEAPDAPDAIWTVQVLARGDAFEVRDENHHPVIQGSYLTEYPAFAALLAGQPRATLHVRRAGP